MIRQLLPKNSFGKQVLIHVFLLMQSEMNELIEIFSKTNRNNGKV
jgi:hypothetical protein